MSTYRIVKQTFVDESVKFSIEKESLAWKGKWTNITNRSSIEEARNAISYLKGLELVSSEVVE